MNISFNVSIQYDFEYITQYFDTLCVFYTLYMYQYILYSYVSDRYIVKSKELHPNILHLVIHSRFGKNKKIYKLFK